MVIAKTSRIAREMNASEPMTASGAAMSSCTVRLIEEKSMPKAYTKPIRENAPSRMIPCTMYIGPITPPPTVVTAA